MTGLLVYRAGGQLCALPLKSAVEVMRPLPLTPFPGAPEFVSGVAVIRGAPVPVVDVARLISGVEASVTRWISVRAGERRVALAVAAVEGTRLVEDEAMLALPPLVSDVEGGPIGSLLTLDAELWLVLQASHVIPESMWTLPE